MRAFIPIDITQATLANSSIPEFDSDEPEWDPETSYAEGAFVSRAPPSSVPKLYKSLIAGNIDNDPATSPTKWIEKSYTNRYRMFEWLQGNISRGASPLVVTIRPKSMIDAAMIGGIKGSHIKIEVGDGSPNDVIYSDEKDMLARFPTSPYEWFFLPHEQIRLYSTFDIPPSLDPFITLTITSNNGFCEIERFAVGQSAYLGDEQWEAESEDRSFSDITYDLGKATLTPVEGVPMGSLELIAPAGQVDRINRFKRSANARIVAWSGMQRLDAYRESFSIFGVQEHYRMVAANHKEATYELKISGV